ncbi:YaiO family outer membrane beta-barrel protein [Sediminicola luteus]|uniref:YaiO beta-barrel domain-containing protein n=1 Tax=Sediminicola luteus TaxID=319238 RepID=A0A2A4GD02_9FLAO|nr:YaiO family outer membrane beta-barrel protein [Sediminicola luteus]PCE65846.1 hypothetical protein B7P33_00660 [Sediminicola luteus]
MKNRIGILTLFFCFNHLVSAQQIDTDSLLVAAYGYYRAQNFELAQEATELGIRLSPDYLDFQLLLGRLAQKKGDSEKAQDLFALVLEKDPRYEEAYLPLSRLYRANGDQSQAKTIVNQGLAAFPNNIELLLEKSKYLKGKSKRAYLKELEARFPNDSLLQATIHKKRIPVTADRLATGYNYTAFDREGAGPWHLASLAYILERPGFAIIPRINYNERRALGLSTGTGWQLESDLYLNQVNGNYHFIKLALGETPIFPKFRASYSHYFNIASSWELDLGARYLNTANKDPYAAVAGIGWYTGDHWIYLKGYATFDENYSYPSLNLSARKYFKDRYQFLGILIGYGNSPDDRVNLNRLDRFRALDAYSAGLRGQSPIGRHLILGVGFTYSYQEYIKDRFQNSFDTNLYLQYKF